VISAYEAFARWEINRDRALLFAGFCALSIFMALFRRHYRKKFDKRSNSSE
jgi:preprotein translocase subunit SecG